MPRHTPGSPPPLQRLRPALLATCVLGAVVGGAALLAELTGIFLLGLFLFLAGGFAWTVTTAGPASR
jgi:hypothetical protein